MSGELIERAADFLDEYAAFIHTVKADDLVCHPYLPELEDVAKGLRDEVSCRSKCPTCHGTGVEECPAYWDGAAECSECEGTGSSNPTRAELNGERRGAGDYLRDALCAVPRSLDRD